MIDCAIAAIAAQEISRNLARVLPEGNVASEAYVGPSFSSANACTKKPDASTCAKRPAERQESVLP